MLNHLPIDILSILNHFLDGEEIDRLWACGNFILNQKLLQPRAASSYIVSWDGIDDLIVSAFVKRNPNLMTFELNASEFAFGRALGNLQHKVLNLPKSLTSLKLQAKDVFRSFTSLNSVGIEMRTEIISKHPSISMKEQFPNLTTLEIHSSNGLSIQFLENLPSRLEKLVLVGGHGPLHETDSLYFPASLKHLETDLVISFSDVKEARMLPDTLEVLICYSAFESNFIHLLPSHLKKLSVTQVNTRNREVGPLDWSQLPPQLEYLWTNRKYLTPEEISQMPRSLTYLMIDTSQTLDDRFIPHLPPNLSKICLGYSIAVEHEWRNLPRDLIWIGDGPLTHLKPPQLDQLPPKLTRVDLSTMNFAGDELSLLPRTVLRLRLQKLENGVSKYLPPSLTHLSIAEANCPPQDVQCWPRTIHTLQLGGNSLPDVECLKYLPSELRKLHLFGFGTQWPSHAFSYLPIGLESLRISCLGGISTDEFVKGLMNHTNLEVLEISDKMSRLTAHVFQWLPKSIKLLDIAMENEPIQGSSLENLPLGLRVLKLQSSASMPWSDQDMGLFPRELVQIDIPRCFTPLTKASLKYLPRHLSDFSIDGSPPFFWLAKTDEAPKRK